MAIVRIKRPKVPTTVLATVKTDPNVGFLHYSVEESNFLGNILIRDGPELS